MAFASAYVTQGTFVAGLGWGDVIIAFRMALGNASIELLVHSPIITFDHVDMNDAANGILAGVLDPIELAKAIEGAALESGQQQVCTSDTLTQLEQAADILGDRSNTPGVTCDHISFAVGFHARSIHDPTSVAPALPPPPTCQ